MPLSKRRSEQENVFTTNNTRPNQKINRLNQSALILTQGLTTAALQCTVKPLFFFFLIKHNRSINNQNKITSNNQKKQSPQPLNQKHSKYKPSKQTRQTISSINRKINHKNNHNKQSKISQSKTRPKQNITNKHEKMQRFEY